MGAGALVLHRSLFTDPTGRIVASRVVPPSITLSCQAPFRLSKTAIRSLLLELTARRTQIPDDGFTEWAEQTERLHHAFWSCRIAREQAIARAVNRASPAPIQRGLFERIAEQRWEADRERRADIVEGLDERLRHATRALVVRFLEPRPALIAVR